MEIPKLIKLGNGLSVPSVQELAKLTLAEIPSRYICTGESPLTNIGASVTDDETVPVIDLQNLLSPEPVVGKLELDKLHSACKEWGFFQLVNHGVDALLMDNIKSEIKGFFNLPIEGFGQAYIESEDQRLDWTDWFVMLSQPLHLRKTHLFPELPLPFRETLESYLSEMKKLSMVVFERMEKALQLVENNCMTLVLGLTSHSDFSSLTILLQLNEVDGLQIRKEEKWISIKPLSDAFIVNVGDILEIMTNGIYRSVDHRAVVNSTKERLSIATFHDPILESEIGPISSLVTPETPASFKRGRYEDILTENLSRKLDGKSFLDYLSM
ncbi:hypothetical protein MKX03_003121 [Papaver bracteatum]|nr:hypothetical protein MKX03_003121 [Papaver bracteatum]